MSHVAAARRLARTSVSWPGITFSVSTEDIAPATVWSFSLASHVVIVHLGGTITTLETELEGCGSVLDPPMAGEVWVIPAGLHYCSYAHGTQVCYAMLVIDPGYLDALLGQTDPSATIVPHVGHFDDFFYRSVQHLAPLMTTTDDVSRMFCQTLGQTLGLHLVRTYSSRRDNTYSTLRRPRLEAYVVKRIEDYVDTHIHEPITLEALAALAGMRIHVLLRAFRASFGTTPAQYVIEQRLRRARWLLTHTTDDITTIAYATGFASHSHFTTTFKARVGVTPQAFRQAQGTT